MYQFEEAMRQKGLRIIAGTDEAGRGPLAGPVVAACVILPEDQKMRIPGLNDSKLISEKKREKLFTEIMNNAQVGVGIVSEKIIDKINIYQASRLAMKIAFEKLPVRPDGLLIDGRMHLDVPCETQAIVKGDRKSASVAAASIIAKVTRDHLMREFHVQYPQYEFDRHKGYPTAIHFELLKLYGPCPIHRRSFAPVREVLLSHAG